MPDTTPVLCPQCGWTGADTAVDTVPGGAACPACGAELELDAD